MENLDLLEPERLYKNELKEKHHENVVSLFDELTKTSGVDIEGNKITCNKLHKEEAALKKTEKELSKLNAFKVFLIVLIVLASIATLVGVILAVKEIDSSWIFLVFGPLILIGSILLIALVLSPKIKNAENIKEDIIDKINRLLLEAKSQMASLNALFSSSIPAMLFAKTCPLITMDRIFDVEKYEMMKERFDLWGNEDENVSTLDIQSGSILGNPFVIFKDLNMMMSDFRYEGRLTVTYSVGIGKDRHTETEVLHAYYTAPKPNYYSDTYLVFGSDAANRLSFSREPSNISSMNEKEIKDYVRKHEKDLDKMAAKVLKKGGNYVPIGNPEFELFFGGLDRDNEVEFRLLFTALGQKSMMDLLKSHDGYGDDFSFRKIKGLNIIKSKHSQGTTLFTNADYFKGFEYDTIKENFISYNDEYFKALFFDFAPLLSIPLYQQFKTKEYIYQGTPKSNFAPFEHEMLLNRGNRLSFAAEKTKTEVILKTLVSKKATNSDIVEVTAHSFDAINRVETVPVMARNGRTYYVDVPWVEYVPLVNKSQAEISDIGVDDEAKFNSLGNNDVIYAKGLVSKYGDNLNVDIKKIKDFMTKSK